MPATEFSPALLSRDEIAAFERDGYLGPFTAFSPDEMATLRSRLEDEVFPTGRLQTRHLDLPLIYQLASAPDIIDRGADLLGGPCVLWQTNFFIKRPGEKQVPWHQDINYWPIEPAINVSAWLAIDNVDCENACVQLIPGSHHHRLEHSAPKDEGMRGFTGAVDLSTLPFEPRVVNMELKAGQFFLFTEKMLHHSEPNTSDRRRAGMVVRMTMPEVRIKPGHVPGVIRMRGEKACEHNPELPPPV